jgi:hypothetical protein
MKKILLILLFILPSFLFAQTTLQVEIRDYDGDQGCGGGLGFSGWTWYYNWNDFSLARADSFPHCNNAGYDDTAQSVVIGKTKYEINCACREANPINMFIRNYFTNALLDSLIIYSDQVGHTTHRLTLLGVCRLIGTDSLLLGGYERQGEPDAITHADTMFGIWKWKPSETTAYWAYDTETSGGYGMNGLVMKDSLVYIVSQNTDTLEVINANTWAQHAVKDMGQTGGSFRGIALIDTTIIVCNSTDKTLDYYGITALNAMTPATKDMTYIVDTGNILYGVWTYKHSSRAGIVIQ